MPSAPCPAAVRPAPVCAPAAVLGDDGDHPDPPGWLPHPLQLRAVRGALPRAAAGGEARLQAGTGLETETAGGTVPALAWAGPWFSHGDRVLGSTLARPPPVWLGKSGRSQQRASKGLDRRAPPAWPSRAWCSGRDQGCPAGPGTSAVEMVLQTSGPAKEKTGSQKAGPGQGHTAWQRQSWSQSPAPGLGRDTQGPFSQVGLPIPLCTP